MRYSFSFLISSFFFFLLPSLAIAAPPVVDTTIKVEKTGSEPFDGATWDGSDLATAGLDADEDNNTVRLQDSITYRVEVSVNDAPVAEMTATVELDKKQAWIEIPTGCKDVPDVIAPSTISADGRTLFCNMGPAVEGTQKVVFPAARVIGASYDGTEVTINDDIVGASVTAEADGISNIAADGPTETIVTANFRVNTKKAFITPDRDTNDDGLLDIVFVAQNKPGPAGEDGYLMEYVITSEYQNGSMIADSDEVTFEVDYDLFDFYTDDNLNNNGALSTGGLLYTWDATTLPCELLGDHGANATVACVANNVVGDYTGPALAPDGLLEATVDIDLDKIDVRDPDGDGNLIAVKVNIWFPTLEDIRSHQTCATGLCTNTIINQVGVYDIASGTPIPFDPVSTEDASGNNLLNYNGASEPFPADNFKSYPLIESSPGSWSVRKSFEGVLTGKVDTKTPEQLVSPGSTVPLALTIYARNSFIVTDPTLQLCDKIDTTSYEYQGLAPSGDNDVGWIYNTNSPGYYVAGPNGPLTGFQHTTGGYEAIRLYSDEPNLSLTELRDDVCEDDVNGDGFVNIQDAAGVQSSPGNPVDWYEDWTQVAGDVSKIRLEYEPDSTVFSAIKIAYTGAYYHEQHLLKIKDTATGYGANSYLPNFITARAVDAAGVGDWIDTSTLTDDPEAVNFSNSTIYADRNVLVSSSISIAKGTDPESIKVVRAGDIVDFVIKPSVFGIWTGAETAKVVDTLPAGTDYLAGSEMFSVDNGVTWLDFTAYNASAPAVTLTSAANPPDSSLLWEFGDLLSGDQLPWIRYSIKANELIVPGRYTNRATLTSDIGSDADGNGVADPKTQPYALTVLPEFGLDVSKLNQSDVYSVNTPFIFEVIYKNLGGESYGGGAFIDILPYKTDGSGIISSGIASTREPGSIYNGIFEVTEMVGSNGEIFFATSAAPASIPTDPCHEDNQPLGVVPVAGDLCFEMYDKNGGAFAGGGAAGTGVIVWDACTALTTPVTCGAIAPADITGIRFETPTLPASAGGRVVTFELTPIGNLGGVPDIDASSNVTAASTGDIYTNTFGGRIPEISLFVISNDVSVTMVSGSIGDTIWLDTSNDGLQDTGEPGLANVDVHLLDAAGDPIYIDPITGAVVPSTWPGAIPYVITTGADGVYLFENLPPGDYQIEIDPATLPPGISSTFDPDGGGDNTSNYSLMEETDPLTGEVTGVEDEEGQDFGYYVPTGTLGDRVWFDTNGDGIEDGDELGVEGMAVTLYCFGPDGLLGGGDDIVFTTETDENGDYFFDGLFAYNYQVQFTPPAGFSFTSNDSGGDDALDSDADPFTGFSPIIPMAVGEDVSDIDAGITEDPTTASLGDTVWLDTDGDGIQGPDEPGVPGVTVTATYFGPDGVPGGGDDQIFPIVTDANGNYLFTNLPPGEYSVTFTPPPGFDFTGANLGGDPELDSDADPLTGSTSTFTLNAGDINLSVDAGLVETPVNPPGLASVLWNGFCDQQNFVSMTNTCTDPVTVTVALYNSSGGLLSTEVLSFAAGAQIDHSINDMTGFSMVDYGRADLLSDPGGCITGEMGLFAPIGEGQYFSAQITESNLGGESELFALDNGSMSNSCYAGFNTFQPSLDPIDQGLATIHFLQLVNMEPTKKLSFTVNRYDMFGDLFSTERVSVDPGGRQDISAGHEDTELSLYGLVEVVPSEMGADYQAQLFRYGLDSSVLDGDRMSSFDLADNCSTGESGPQYLTVSRGAGASNWLELYNINRASERVSVNVYSNTKGLVGTYNFDLDALQTVHFDAGEGLMEGESGVAEIRTLHDSRILAKSTSYIYRADGKIKSSDTTEGKGPLGAESFGSYNTFRNQLNWLRVFNTTASELLVTVVGYSQGSDEELGRRTVALSGLRGEDLNLNGLFDLEGASVGRVRLVSSIPGAVVADIVRVEHDDTFTELRAIEVFELR